MSLAADYFKERLGDSTIECDEGYITYKYMTYHKLKAVYIRDIYVIPSQRHNRIGTLLGDKVVEIAKKEGAIVALGTVDMSTRTAKESMECLLYWGMKPVAFAEGLIWFMKPIIDNVHDIENHMYDNILYDENRSHYGNYIGERIGDHIIECDEGFVTYKMMPYKESPACYIKEIFTTKEARGKGVADMLGKQVTDIAKEKGCKLLVGTVDTKSKGCDYALKGFLWWGFELDDMHSGVIWITKKI